MKLAIVKGSTSYTVNVFIQDSSSTTGAGLTGLVFNTASLVAYYARPKAAATAITLATLAAVTSAYSSGGFKEIDATNMPGWYRFDIPDAALATGVDFVSIHLKGATNMAPLPLEVQLTSVDLNDGVRAALTALPNATAGANTGLPVVGTQVPNATAGASAGLLISGSNSGTTTFGALTVTGATTMTGGLAISAGATITGSATGAALTLTGGGTSGEGLKILTTSGDGILVTPTAGNALTLTANGTSKHGAVVTGGTAGTSDGIKAVAGTGGVDIRGNITGNLVGTVSTLTTYTGNTPQTGDAFARLGAPAGASVSVDIAAVKTDTAAVKVQTDKLAFTVANQVDANVLDWKSATAPAMTGDAFARLGAPAGASVSADVAAVKSDTAAVKAKTDNLPAAPAATGDAMTLTAGERNSTADAILTRSMTEAYSTKGGTLTLSTAAYEIVQMLGEKGVGGTTLTVKKRDQVTTAETFTLNDATAPTAITRAT